MHLKYRRINHLLHFKQAVTFPTLPPFLFRSVLGKELRRLACIFRGRPCSECGLKYTCAYSWIFETPLERQPKVLEGRDRGSHPFLLAANIEPGKSVQEFTLTLTLVGKAIEYYPYLFYALKKAGEVGVLRERIPFEIQDIQCEGKPILQGTDTLHPTLGIQEWRLSSKDSANASYCQRRQVVLETPLRFRAEGKYTDQFSASQFLQALYRRAQILCSLYGGIEAEVEKDGAGGKLSLTVGGAKDFRIISRSFRWTDYPYYSSRQKKLLKMGGVLGDFVLEGVLSLTEESLLHFGELFHVGKNTAFGLGKYHIQPL